MVKVSAEVSAEVSAAYVADTSKVARGCLVEVAFLHSHCPFFFSHFFMGENRQQIGHANGSSEVVAKGHSCEVSLTCASVSSTETPHCRAPGVIHTLLSHNLGAKVVQVQSSGSVVLVPSGVQKRVARAPARFIFTLTLAAYFSLVR